MNEFGNTISSYNRIVIVGNGFDIALGLKTKYQDFILYFIKESIKKSNHSRPFESRLLKIIISPNLDINQSREVIDRIQDLDELFNILDNNVYIDYKGKLMKGIKNELNRIKKWVDIESLYFKLLLSEIEGIRTQNAFHKDYSPILELNEDFKELSDELNKYIATIDFDVKDEGKKMKQLINDLIKNESKEKKTRSVSMLKSNPETILFLNFNYTSTLNTAIESVPYTGKKIDQINIHGFAHLNENKVIFGYGDDMHKHYQDIEDEDFDAALKYIKSFYYTFDDNYQKLVNFLFDKHYEVIILGHSCGLSDRTLLKTIFENSNCLSIKIYHYLGLDEHFEKSIAISRHCENKAQMRQRIVPFDADARIPQF